MDNQSDPDPGRSGEGAQPAGKRSGEHARAAPAAGQEGPGAPEERADAAREPAEVSVPIWRLTPKQRAALLRIVKSGGRVERRRIPREQLAVLLQAGYLASYDQGTVILTPAALRAITAAVDRRATARGATGQRPRRRPPLSP